MFLEKFQTKILEMEIGNWKLEIMWNFITGDRVQFQICLFEKTSTLQRRTKIIIQVTPFTYTYTYTEYRINIPHTNVPVYSVRRYNISKLSPISVTSYWHSVLLFNDSCILWFDRSCVTNLQYYLI